MSDRQVHLFLNWLGGTVALVVAVAVVLFATGRVLLGVLALLAALVGIALFATVVVRKVLIQRPDS